MVAATQIQVSEVGNNLTTIIVQTVCEAREAKSTDYGPLTGLLRVEAAKKLGWQSNPGAVIELLLQSIGCDFSADGTKLWRRSTPENTLKARPLAAPNSRRPAAARETTLGALEALSLEHDQETWASGVGRREG